MSGQNYGMDSEIARVKLEVERVRLLMWGQAVGLSSVRLPEEGVTSLGPCHPRLGRSEVTDAVMRILGCIHHLFKDTDALQRRYGLQRTSERSSASAVLDISPENNASSATILESVFKKAYASLQKSSRRNNRITTLRKVRLHIVSRGVLGPYIWLSARIGLSLIRRSSACSYRRSVRSTTV